MLSPISMIKLFLAFLCLPFPVLAQQLSAAESPWLAQPLRVPEAGMLLVASKSMRDPSFRQAVVLIIEHSNQGGTVGLIINRRTDTALGTLLPEFAEADDGIRRSIYLGGPIAGGGLVYLHRAELRAAMPRDAVNPGRRQVTSGVMLGQQESELLGLLKTGTADNALRVYIGYSGWGPQQLRTELQAGAWTLQQASAELVFFGSPDELWQRLQDGSRGGGLVVRAVAGEFD